MKFVRSGIENWIEGRGYSKNLLLDRIDLLSTKALVQVIKIKPGERAGNHHHKNTTEIFYGLEGAGDFFINNEKVIFSKGDLLICEKHEVHSTINSSKNDWTYLAVKTDNKEDIFWE